MSAEFTDSRRPLEGTLEIHGERITIRGVRGMGSASICYDAYTEDSGHTRILKQFYPDPRLFNVRIERNGTELEIDGYDEIPELRELGERFVEAYRIQNELSNGEAMYAIVKTDWCESHGATKFAMYEANWDTRTLYQSSAAGVAEKLLQCLQTAEALHKIHQKGVLYLDLKPENVLWDEENKQVKLFDFDAAIDTSKLDAVHELRASSRSWLAPEIRSMQSFDQDKKLYLDAKSGPKTDVFSLGCMMFRYLFGEDPTEEEEKSCDISVRLQRLIQSSADWRKLFSEEEQTLFCRIVTKSVAYRRRDRYASCEELAEDLRRLLDSLRAGKRREYAASPETLRLLSAQLLNENPLFEYASEDADGRPVLDAVIVGSAPIRDALFKNIFACAQLPDTELILRVIADDAEDYWEQLKKDCPLLKTTASVTLNGLEKHGDLDREIAPTPLARLHFYESDCADTEDEAQTVLREYENGPMPRYYLLVSENSDANLRAARSILRAARKQKQPVFVGYLDERGDGFDLRKLGFERLPKRIRFAAFGANSKFTPAEREFREEIERRAFAIHSYYTKHYMEKAPLEELKQGFYYGQKGYNYRSSMRSALSIPYKLHACGIGHREENAGLRFSREVLAQSGKPGGTTMKDRMIWLEHRSWLAFMITEGWTRPTRAELEAYAFYPGYDHRDKTRKLHPCICASEIGRPMLRDAMSKRKWDKLSEEEIGQLDPLDQTSVRLHQFCDRITREHRDLRNLFDSLKSTLRDELRDQSGGSELLADVDQLRELARRMKRGEPNVNSVWARAVSDCAAKFQGKKLESAGKKLTQIKDEMAIVSERNKYADYKTNDEEILEAVPFLLLKHPVCRVYKLLSANDWENLLSTILLEPEELVLLSDTPAGSDRLGGWRRFLNSRGLGHIRVSCKLLTELHPGRKSAALDITGASPELVYRAIASAALRGVPVLVCKNGGVFSPSGSAEVELCAKKRTLTVEETLSLLGAGAKKREDQTLPDLANVYRKLWDAYFAAKKLPNSSGKEGRSAFPWKIFTDFVAQTEQDRYAPFDPGPRFDEPKVFYSNTVERSLADGRGVSRMLEELMSAKIVRGYTLPDEDGPIRIETQYHKLVQTINQLYAEAGERQCSYRLKKLWNEPLGGKPFSAGKLYLYRLTNLSKLEVRAVVPCREELSRGKRSTEKYVNTDIIKGILELLSGKKAGAEPFVSPCAPSVPFVRKIDGTENYEVCFRFLNQAIKEFFLKEGNALEAYTYHTIREKGLFDDYQMNVTFMWDSSEEEEFRQYGAITNEIDVLCTKGVRSVFISCKQCELQKEHLFEIRYLADRFGVNARAILICSHPSTENLDERSAVVQRAKSMGIAIIPESKINEASFAKAIQAAVKESFAGGLV